MWPSWLLNRRYFKLFTCCGLVDLRAAGRLSGDRDLDLRGFT